MFHFIGKNLWFIEINKFPLNFPGDPVVKTLCFHWSKHRFYPWSVKILHAMQHDQKIKLKTFFFKFKTSLGNKVRDFLSFTPIYTRRYYFIWQFCLRILQMNIISSQTPYVHASYNLHHTKLRTCVLNNLWSLLHC